MRYNEIPTIAGRKVVTFNTNKGEIQGRIKQAAHNCFYVTQVGGVALQIRATLVSTVVVAGETIEVQASRF